MKKYKTGSLHSCILKLLHKYYTVIVEVTHKIRTPFETRKQQQGGLKKSSNGKTLWKVMSSSYQMAALDSQKNLDRHYRANLTCQKPTL